jgi:hypothetical protein
MVVVSHADQSGLTICRLAMEGLAVIDVDNVLHVHCKFSEGTIHRVEVRVRTKYIVEEWMIHCKGEAGRKLEDC